MESQQTSAYDSHGLSGQAGRLDLLCQVLDRHTPESLLAAQLNLLPPTGWEELVSLAQQQGVLAGLSAVLADLAGIITPPAKILGDLRQAHYETAARTMLMLHEAHQVLSALNKQGLDVISLKGLFLVDHVYKDVGLRSFGDLDLMVKKEAIPQAIAVLQGLGYRLDTYFNTRDLNQDIKHVPPMSKPGGATVELHWTILEEDEPFTIDADGLWARSVPARIADLDGLALCPEDLLLHLCLHFAYQHRLKLGLRGVLDISETLHTYSNSLNWQQLIQTAQAWGAQRVTWLVLSLAAEMLGAEIPRPVFSQLMSGPVDPAVLMEARKQLLGDEGQALMMTPDLARLAATTSFEGRLKVLLGRVFITRQALARLYNISPRSPAIFWGYLRRLGDLWRSYGQSLRQVFAGDRAVLQRAADRQANQDLHEWMAK